MAEPSYSGMSFNNAAQRIKPWEYRLRLARRSELGAAFSMRAVMSRKSEGWRSVASAAKSSRPLS
jgi:hypothetical protein